MGLDLLHRISVADAWKRFDTGKVPEIGLELSKVIVVSSFLHLHKCSNATCRSVSSECILATQLSYHLQRNQGGRPCKVKIARFYPRNTCALRNATKTRAIPIKSLGAKST